MSDEQCSHNPEAIKDKIRQDVNKFGVSVIRVQGDESEPAFAYSIGLKESFEQPELILFGLPPLLMHDAINSVADLLRDGLQIKADGMLENLFQGHHGKSYAGVLKDVPDSCVSEFMKYATWFNGGLNFEALQIVWPDAQNRFPWDSGFDLPKLQPRLWERLGLH